MRHNGRFRRIVLRHGRRFVVCGLRRPPLRHNPELAPLPFGWRTRATLLIVAVAVAFAVLRPPAVPTGPEQPAIGFARYSIDDFANASR